MKNTSFQEDGPASLRRGEVYSGYIDGHCHLADPRPGFDPQQAIEEAKRAGVARFLQGGIHPADWERQFTLAARYPTQVFCACGMHPVWVSQAREYEIAAALSALPQELKRAQVRGLGELGLDARPDYRHALDRQAEVFRAQLRIAQSLDLPLILHVVREHRLALRILKEEGVPARGGMVHSFSGGASEAKAYVDLGLHLSVSGGNFQGGDRKVREAAAKVPASSWLLETDAPDQKHPDWAGEWSVPARLLDVARWMGSVLSQKEEAILTDSADRLEKIFKLGS